MPLINELKGFDLLKITDIHVFKATEMFEDLRIGKIESKRNRQFGPVAASKTLMAINPNVFAAWDNKIAKSIYGGKTSMHYKAHLIETKKFAQTVFSHADLLELIDPSNRIGIGKIIDEALYWGVSVK